jgi:8-oxo-dGTP pyrophosphatase MutT (NUDIX family)
MEIERAGLLVVREGNLALIERQWQGRHYWVIPGGGIEARETIADAAHREGEEELGVPVEVGALRVRIDHREEDGSIQRQWYFEATVKTDDIHVAGPEANCPERGSFKAVWIEPNDLEARVIFPSTVAHLVSKYRDDWPTAVIEIDET